MLRPLSLYTFERFLKIAKSLLLFGLPTILKCFLGGQYRYKFSEVLLVKTILPLLIMAFTRSQKKNANPSQILDLSSIHLEALDVATGGE